MANGKHPWHTLRNSNSMSTVSSDGEYLIVPVTEKPSRSTGLSVIRICDLAPTFATQREAMDWIENNRTK
jgi:hypothetical protein